MVKPECPEIRQDLGYMFLLGSTIGVLWGPLAKAGLVNQTRRLGVLLSSVEIVYKHTRRERQWRLLISRVIGEAIENSHLPVTELLPRSCLRSLCPFKVPADCMEY